MTVIRVVDDLPGLEELLEPWEALAADPSLPPTTRPRWFAAAARTLYAEDQLHLVVVEDAGEVVAVAPLGTRGKAGRGPWEVLSSGDVYEPVTLAHRDEGALAELMTSLLSGRWPVRLGRLANDGPELRWLDHTRRPELVLRRHLPGTPFVDLGGSWEGYQAKRSAARRSSLRRSQRRAEQAGGLDFAVSSPGPQEVDVALDEVIAVEHRSWKGREGTSLAADVRVQAHYRAYAREASRAGELRVCSLRIGGELAAAQLAVESDDRLWILKLGYDDRWSACAPGMLLTRESIRWSFESQLRSYELLGDAAPWTEVWTKAVHPYEAVRLYPLSPRSMVGLAGDVARETRRRRQRRRRSAA